MPKVIVKVRYQKPSAKSHSVRYLKYIATRDGVDKMDDSNKFLPATLSQQKIIEKVLLDSPDTAELFEYEEYLANKTRAGASEFLNIVSEQYYDLLSGKKTYADYIATRPRAENVGSHGLFTDNGVAVNLRAVSEEIKNHGGNVWTLIISLKREDAERLQFDSGERWQKFLQSQTDMIAKNLKIPLVNLKWYGAFHNEGHHPHVHVIAYSKNPKEGYVTEQGIHNIISECAKDIFKNDLYSIYEKQTKLRNETVSISREEIQNIISDIQKGGFSNPVLEGMLKELSTRLANTSGKKVYGYLNADTRVMVNAITDELAKDERISKLYDLWYEQKFAVISTYTSAMPEKLPLSQQTEFKSIKNAIIKEALRLNNPEEQGSKVFINQSENADTQSIGSDQTFTKLKVSNGQSGSNASAVKLLYHLSRIFQNRIEDDKKKNGIKDVDKKVLQKIAEKKQAQGLKM